MPDCGDLIVFARDNAVDRLLDGRDRCGSRVSRLRLGLVRRLRLLRLRGRLDGNGTQQQH
jgi:hypothetical protein